MKLKLFYETPCTEEITIRTEANFVATGGIPGGTTGDSSTEDLEEVDYSSAIWS